MCHEQEALVDSAVAVYFVTPSFLRRYKLSLRDVQVEDENRPHWNTQTS